MRILRTGSAEVTEGQGLPPGGQSPPQEGKGLNGVCQQPTPPLSVWPGPCPRTAQDTPLQTVFLLGVFGRYGHIVEHAEPVGSSPLAVVPRRSAGEN